MARSGDYLEWILPRLRGRFPDQFDEIDAAALERGEPGGAP